MGFGRKPDTPGCGVGVRGCEVDRNRNVVAYPGGAKLEFFGQLDGGRHHIWFGERPEVGHMQTDRDHSVPSFDERWMAGNTRFSFQAMKACSGTGWDSRRGV